MVFRRDNKVDAFQRQISALRQQLGPEGENPEPETSDSPPERDRDVNPYGTPFEATERRQGTDFSFSGFGDPSNQSGENESDGYQEDESSPAPLIPEVDANTSIIAADAIWTGTLESGGAIHVHGRVEGSITSKLDVYVAEEAVVDATVTALNVVVAGRVQGSITCLGRFEALPEGRVTADVQAPALVVHQGASLTGQFRMSAAEAPANESAPPPVVHRRTARGGA